MYEKVQGWIVVSGSTGTYWMHNDHPNIYIEQQLAKDAAERLDETNPRLRVRAVRCAITYRPPARKKKTKK
jgi:hypothetical protein